MVLEKDGALPDAATAAVLERGEAELQTVCTDREPLCSSGSPGAAAASPRRVALRGGAPQRLADGRADRGKQPDGVKRLMHAARCDADAVRDDLRRSVVEHLGDPQSVLVIDSL